MLERDTVNEIGSVRHPEGEIEGVRAIFHIEGVTDLKSQIETLRRQGITVYNLHEHAFREPCNERCVLAVRDHWDATLEEES